MKVITFMTQYRNCFLFFACQFISKAARIMTTTLHTDKFKVARIMTTKLHTDEFLCS